jgi:hypothetical protein
VPSWAWPTGVIGDTRNRGSRRLVVARSLTLAGAWPRSAAPALPHAGAGSWPVSASRLGALPSVSAKGRSRPRADTAATFARARYGYIYGLMKRIGIEAVVGRIKRCTPMRRRSSGASRLQIPFFELLRSRAERP